MTIAFDARWIQPEMSGIGRYSAGVLHGLVAIGGPTRHQLLLLGGDAQLLDQCIGQPSWAKLLPCDLPPGSLRSQRALPAILLANGATLFHSPYVFAPLRARHVKVVTTVHDLIPQRYPQGLRKAWKVRLSPLWNQWCRWQYARSSAIVTVSDFSRRELIESAGIDGARVMRIYNGVKSSSTDADASMFREVMNIRAPIISYVGRHDPYKNIETLIRAFAKVAQEVGDAVLVVGGRKDARYPQNEALARSSQHASRILFTDYLSEPMRISLIRASSVFVFPSRYEGFGLPPLEAMAEGIPVVSSRATSLQEVIGDAGLLHDPDDVEGFAQSIIRLLRDQSLRSEIIERGRARATQFTWEKSASEHLGLWTDLLADRSPALT